MTLDRQFRIFAAESTQTIQKARDLHDLSPLATLLMGRMLTAVALMSLELKQAGSEISLRVEGDGPLSGATVIAKTNGDLRGYAYQPRLFYDHTEENYQISKYLGQGTLTVIKTDPRGKPHQGHTPLINGKIAEDLAHYYLSSEQLPTAIILGVLFDREARIRAGGGFMIQQLPQADPETAEQLINNIAATPFVSDLMDMGLGLPEILKRFVCKDVAFSLEPDRPIRYHCPCSKESFAQALKLLGKEELLELKDGIAPVCHYCNREYEFSAADIAELIAHAKEKP